MIIPPPEVYDTAHKTMYRCASLLDALLAVMSFKLSVEA